jgi:hypothetical protein
MEEVWKIYKKTRTRIYEVSNLGNVKINGVLQSIDKFSVHRGYYRIGTIANHRAVAELFIPNPDNKPEVDHINRNKLDNRAENLRWVTHKENMNNPLTKMYNSEVRSKIDHWWNKGVSPSAESNLKRSNTLKGKQKHNLGKHWKMVDGKRIWYV